MSRPGLGSVESPAASVAVAMKFARAAVAATRATAMRATAASSGRARRCKFDLTRWRLCLLAVRVVVVPPLTRAVGLRVALRRVLPLLLAPERGDVEVAPGSA